MLTASAAKKQFVTTPTRNEHSPQANSSAWHTLSIDIAFERLQADPVQGLTPAEASRRLAQYGQNTLSQAQQRSAWSILFAQFRSLIVALLVAATVIAFAMRDHIEGVAILVVIVINAAIGFLTEWKAERALSALQKQAVPIAHVIRDGTASEIPAAELVPGDLVVLAAGARVPADGRIVECVRLQIEESALTGESNAVTKAADPIEDNEAALGDRLNMAFLGTTITEGRGRLLITDTGAKTEVGKIGVHDSGSGSGLPRLQCAFAKAFGVYRSAVYEWLALACSGHMPDTPGSSRIPSAFAESAPYRPADAVRLGRHHSLFSDASGRSGVSQIDSKIRDSETRSLRCLK